MFGLQESLVLVGSLEETLNGSTSHKLVPRSHCLSRHGFSKTPLVLVFLFGSIVVEIRIMIFSYRSLVLGGEPGGRQEKIIIRIQAQAL